MKPYSRRSLLVPSTILGTFGILSSKRANAVVPVKQLMGPWTIDPKKFPVPNSGAMFYSDSFYGGPVYATRCQFDLEVLGLTAAFHMESDSGEPINSGGFSVQIARESITEGEILTLSHQDLFASLEFNTPLHFNKGEKIQPIWFVGADWHSYGQTTPYSVFIIYRQS